jgi:Family of unknown function (DUF6279)
MLFHLYFNHTRRHIHRHCLLALTCALLSGCSLVGTLYQNATKLALFELSSTLDLNSVQYERGAQRLEAVYQWHRKTELPAIVAQLRSTSALTQSGATPAQLGAVLDAGLAAARRLAYFTLAQQVEWVQSLNADNLAALQKKYAKDNATFRKEWGLNAANASNMLQIAQDKRFETFITWAERIYGTLNQDQTSKLRAASDARVLQVELLYSERILRQQALLAILREQLNKPLSPEQLQAILLDYITKLDRASTPDRQAYFDQNRAQFIALIAQLTQLATPAQRGKAHKTLLEFADTFQAIYEKP